MQYSVVVPVFNEEEVISYTFERLKKTLDTMGSYEIIFVDDGSEDKSYEILSEIARKNENIKVISFTRNFGHQEAVSCGIHYAASDACIIIDADLQDPPEVLPQMAEIWKSGVDIVYGKRTKRKGESGFKKLTAWGFYRFLSLMGAQKIPKYTGDFRLIDKRVVEFLNSLPEKNRFLRGISAWGGFSSQAFEFERDERKFGTTKYTLKKMIKLSGDGITSFSYRPLLIPMVLGSAVLTLGCIYLILAIIFAFIEFWNYIHIMLSCIFVLLGIILLFLGIMGAYISRIYDEAKDRPLYVINKKINV